MSAQCGSTSDGKRCVFGDGHKVDYHSDGNSQWFGAVCEVCGNETDSGRVMSEVEVCRICYAGVEERARVREEERDVYRAALADMVAGMPEAREKAIATLSGRPADPYREKVWRERFDVLTAQCDEAQSESMAFRVAHENFIKLLRTSPVSGAIRMWGEQNDLTIIKKAGAAMLAELIASRAVVAQARNVSPRICGAAGVLDETVKAYGAVVNKGQE